MTTRRSTLSRLRAYRRLERIKDTTPKPMMHSYHPAFWRMLAMWHAEPKHAGMPTLDEIHAQMRQDERRQKETLHA